MGDLEKENLNEEKLKLEWENFFLQEIKLLILTTEKNHEQPATTYGTESKRKRNPIINEIKAENFSTQGHRIKNKNSFLESDFFTSVEKLHPWPLEAGFTTIEKSPQKSNLGSLIHPWWK
jgi:hypothetical protein